MFPEKLDRLNQHRLIRFHKIIAVFGRPQPCSAPASDPDGTMRFGQNLLRDAAEKKPSDGGTSLRTGDDQIRFEFVGFVQNFPRGRTGNGFRRNHPAGKHLPQTGRGVIR